MLLRFEAENLHSFAQAGELSLVATKLRGDESGLLDIPGAAGLKAVPVALIYGANASGKTNIVKAFNFTRNAVLFSHSQGSPAGGVPRIPFALDPSISEMPTRVEVDFVSGDIRYIFGFTCNGENFLTEWLYAFPEGKRRKLYERDGKQVDFGPSMRGAKKALVEFMRGNSLFISTATQNDHEELTNVVGFFRNYVYSSTLAASPMTITNTFKEGQVDSRTISFLDQTGSGVVGLEQREKEVTEQSRAIGRELAAIIRKHTGDESALDAELPDRAKDIEIQLLHRGVAGTNFALPLQRESSGTRRLLLVMSRVLETIDSGGLLIVDELDASLHTLVAEQIISLFSSPELNPKGAQLIATTHDTNVLNCSHIRRDQIWFCEKDEVGGSHLFSLADFKLRPTDKFEKGYLEGRFGAIPFAGDLASIVKGSPDGRAAI